MNAWRLLVVASEDSRLRECLSPLDAHITWTEHVTREALVDIDVVLVPKPTAELAALLQGVPWIALRAEVDRAFELGAADVVEDRVRLPHAVAREARRRRTQRAADDETKKARQLAAKSLAAFQQRALQMEIIRQQNEELDKLAADLAVAVRVRTEFLANFSHEIRTPLNAILGYCDLVLREEGERLSPHGRRDLGVVKQNARVLLELITNILDLSRIEAGHSQVAQEPVDLAALLDECRASVEPLVRAKQLEVRISIAPAARVIVSDSIKLRQVATNLLSNAAKFTESGEVAVEASIDAGNLVLVVEDTGRGIDREHLEVIFEKFRQVEGGTTRRVGGVGLGLAIVRELCRALGGTITVDSTLGRGSRFVVRVPVGVSIPPPAPTISSLVPEVTRTLPRVLYVEDTALNRNLMRRFLADRYELFEAEDGEQGVERATELVPDLILMDLSLPRLDGWEATRRIKANPRLARIPVIAVTAHSGADERRRAKEAGCDRYLTKPLDRKRLLETMSELLAREPGAIEP